MSEEIFYTSPNGDRWVLIRNDNVPVVEHRPNASSGGHTSRVSVQDFLGSENNGPEHQRLRTMQNAASQDVASPRPDLAESRVTPRYLARFSYDFSPADRDKAMEFIRRELLDARNIGLNGRILVPFTRGPSCASIQFEVELIELNQLDEFRHREGSTSLGAKSEWMHAFSSILRSPPSVEILTVHD